jgi:hypothetical protein
VPVISRDTLESFLGVERKKYSDKLSKKITEKRLRAIIIDFINSDIVDEFFTLFAIIAIFNPA